MEKPCPACNVIIPKVHLNTFRVVHNLSADAETFRHNVTSKFPCVRSVIAENTGFNVPVSVVRGLTKDEVPCVRNRAVMWLPVHEVFTEVNRVFKVLKKDPFKFVSNSPTKFSMLYDLASSSKTPADVLVALGTHRVVPQLDRVRARVAANVSTPVTVAALLANDPDPTVASSVVGEPAIADVNVCRRNERVYARAAASIVFPCSLALSKKRLW